MSKPLPHVIITIPRIGGQVCDRCGRSGKSAQTQPCLSGEFRTSWADPGDRYAASGSHDTGDDLVFTQA